MPKANFKDARFVEAIERAMETKTKPQLMDLFEKTVSGWQKRPAFESEQVSNTARISIAVFPFGKGKGIYEIVTRGSPPHTITAKSPSRMLRFQTGYIAATNPGSLIGGRSHRYGDFLRTYYVNHPGFPPRDFDKLIAEKIEPEFSSDMQQVFNEVSQSIGK